MGAELHNQTSLQKLVLVTPTLVPTGMELTAA